MELPARYAAFEGESEQLKEQLQAYGVPQETISACYCNLEFCNLLDNLKKAEAETAKTGEPWMVIRVRDAPFCSTEDFITMRTRPLQEVLVAYAGRRRVAVTSLEFRYHVGGARVDGNTDATALPNGVQLDVVSDFRPPASASPAKKPRTSGPPADLASESPRDDVLDDIRPTIDHINAWRIHYRSHYGHHTSK